MTDDGPQTRREESVRSNGSKQAVFRAAEIISCTDAINQSGLSLISAVKAFGEINKPRKVESASARARTRMPDRLLWKMDDVRSSVCVFVCCSSQARTMINFDEASKLYRTSSGFCFQFWEVDEISPSCQMTRQWFEVEFGAASEVTVFFGNLAAT